MDGDGAPSRYTYGCIEATRAFSVCVPPASLATACSVCGTQSGRDADKLAVLGLKASPGRAAAAPILEACPIVYECAVVHANDINPGRLDAEIDHSAYASGDYHRLYWGRIEAVHLAKDAARRLAE